MYRIEGASEAIRESVPPLLVEAFALVTELGGAAFLLVSLSVLYWIADRETSATVIGFALVALAVTLGLKTAFALPRPPEAVRAVAVDPGSYGFPSGHAIAATVVYGGLLVAGGWGRDVRLVVPTVTLVGLVGLSRVVIGVHYLGDVLAGFAVGVAVLAGLRWTVGHRADHASLVAAACTLPTAIATGWATDPLLALGASLGGAVAFRTVDTASLPVPSTPTERLALVAVGLPLAGGLYWLASTVPVALVAVVGNALVVASVVALPATLRGPPAPIRPGA